MRRTTTPNTLSSTKCSVLIGPLRGRQFPTLVQQHAGMAGLEPHGPQLVLREAQHRRHIIESIVAQNTDVLRWRIGYKDKGKQ
jgi:hypothetical protein